MFVVMVPWPSEVASGRARKRSPSQRAPSLLSLESVWGALRQMAQHLQGLAVANLRQDLNSTHGPHALRTYGAGLFQEAFDALPHFQGGPLGESPSQGWFRLFLEFFEGRARLRALREVLVVKATN